MAATGYVLERLSELREEAYCKVLRCFLASQQYDLVSPNTPSTPALQDIMPPLTVPSVCIGKHTRHHACESLHLFRRRVSCAAGNSVCFLSAALTGLCRAHRRLSGKQVAALVVNV